MWKIEQLKIQKKEKILFTKTKIQNFEFEAPHTHKISILTGIFWLKRISASHYNHFTIWGMLFSDLIAE